MIHQKYDLNLFVQYHDPYCKCNLICAQDLHQHIFIIWFRVCSIMHRFQYMRLCVRTYLNFNIIFLCTISKNPFILMKSKLEFELPNFITSLKPWWFHSPSQKYRLRLLENSMKFADGNGDENRWSRTSTKWLPLEWGWRKSGNK